MRTIVLISNLLVLLGQRACEDAYACGGTGEIGVPCISGDGQIERVADRRIDGDHDRSNVLVGRALLVAKGGIGLGRRKATFPTLESVIAFCMLRSRSCAMRSNQDRSFPLMGKHDSPSTVVFASEPVMKFAGIPSKTIFALGPAV
jgi:hypothetical protein